MITLKQILARNERRTVEKSCKQSRGFRTASVCSLSSDFLERRTRDLSHGSAQELLWITRDRKTSLNEALFSMSSLTFPRCSYAIEFSGTVHTLSHTDTEDAITPQIYPSAGAR